MRRVESADVDHRMIRTVGLRSHTAVLPAGGSFSLRLQLRDCFENHIEAGEEHCDQLQVLVDSEAFYEIEPSSSLPRYLQVKFSFTTTTCDAFPVFLKYSGKQVTSLQLLVLTPDKLEVVNNYVTRMSWNSYYEVQLTKLQGVAQKSKTVYVYLTDRQVSLSDGLKIKYVCPGHHQGVLLEADPPQVGHLQGGAPCHLLCTGAHTE